MAYAQLIDTEYIFIHTTVDSNIDPGILEPSIVVAQDTQIQSILGYNLLGALMNKVDDETITQPGNENYLLLLNNFVQPALAWYSVYYALPEIQYRLTNKTILQKTTDNATATGLTELKYLRDNAKNIAEFYVQRIREEIVNNLNAYPEYFQSVGIDRIKPKRTAYFSGWVPNGHWAKPIGYGSNKGFNGDSDCCDGRTYPLN
jgi:hypothetical protein